MSISAQSVHPVSPVVLVVNHASVTPGPDKPLYLVRPAEGDAVGSLSIPVLRQTLPIIEGTRARRRLARLHAHGPALRGVRG